MRKQFLSIPAGAEVRSVVKDPVPENTGLVPVIEKDASPAGIIEAHDLLEGMHGQAKARDIAGQDYVLARREGTVDQVTHRMLVRNTEDVVVEGNGATRPIGVARDVDILRLRRWVLEEESHFSERPSTGQTQTCRTLAVGSQFCKLVR
jgi:signal-transduction protein with cAMP-binding, CBS, and nucleotidyltransferase domain